MDKLTLTNNELEIMELLWTQGRPLSRTEIIELTPERSWSSKSIHIILNKLIEKGTIEVSGFVRTNKNYGRTYSPCITPDDYVVSSIRQSIKEVGHASKPRAIASVFAALIAEKDVDEELLSSLEQILAEKKRKLNK